MKIGFLGGGNMASALIGGLILNVMPCVFPVLSIKALSLAQGNESEARRHGIFFLLGVLATFLALAGALIALQAAGAEIASALMREYRVCIQSMANCGS